MKPFVFPAAPGYALFTLLLSLAGNACGASADALFKEGAERYRAGDYVGAGQVLHQSARLQPASGTLQNLGNAEWQRGRVGPAVRSWEQALWLDPFNEAARMDLRFARKTAQLEAPDVAWYEAVSSWLPANWWAWIAGISFWSAIGLTLLPGIFRRRKAGWHQAVAAFGFMIFLLSLPAHFGVHTRSHLGFVLQKDTPLLMTPTLEAQAVARLTPGEPARWERKRGNYLLIRTNRGRGWVDKELFGLICADS